MNTTSNLEKRTPWHLWLVGILALLWNGAAAIGVMMAQANKLPDISPEEAAYYAAQPMWLVIATDVALLSAVAASILLLLRQRAAVWLFAVSIVAIFVTNIYDLAAPTSRILASRGALFMTIIIAGLAILQFVYAFAMKRRVVLR
jgi:hypothetical protein